MSDSDQTWSAGADEPVEPNWPQYSWPHPDDDVATTPSATNPPAAPDATNPESTFAPVTPPAATSPEATPPAATVSWPPTQPNATTATNPESIPDPTAPYAAGPYASGPYASAPYVTAPNPSGPYATGPAVWPPTATPEPTTTATGGPTKARRGLAVVAALALVLASAGVGAGVALAVHNKSTPQSFAASNNVPSFNGNSGSSGSTGNNGSSGSSGNSGGFGSGGFGSGNGSTGGSGNSTLPAGSGSLNVSAIAGKVDPALVNINTTLAQGRAAGTGMLISSTGEILTNNHVIAGAETIKVVIGGNGASHDAKVLGYDVTEDVALLQITDNVSNLPTISFGDPSKVQIGDPVVAIGNALGAGGTPKASQGQVTALEQEVTAGDQSGESETLEGMIQINAPIQPGDSGGALVDANGKIIGMNTAAAGNNSGQFNQSASNVGFAIPIDDAVNIVTQIRTGKDTDKVHIGDRALLGILAQDLNGGNTNVSAGAAVQSVQSNTGAASAGIKENDVIVSINGNNIADSAALRASLAPLHPGESVSVGWVDSNGTRHDTSIKLVAGPPL